MIQRISLPRFLVQCFLILGVLVGNLSAQAPTDDIRGPKSVVEIPVPEKSNLLLGCSIAAAVLVLMIVLYLWKKRRRKITLQNPTEVALAALAELEKSPQPRPAEEFADLAAQTIRHFIMERFGIAAPRRTTEEFLQALSHDESSPLTHESVPLKKFLSSCDLAKFAGSSLTPTQRGELLEAARAFVTATSHRATS